MAQSCPLFGHVVCSPPVSPSMEFPRQGHRCRLPSPSPGDLPGPGAEPHLLHRTEGGLYRLGYEGSPAGTHTGKAISEHPCVLCFVCVLLECLRRVMRWHLLPLVQSLSRVPLFETPWTAARQASLSFTISQSLLKLTSIESMMPSNHLTFCRPLLPSIFPGIRVFSYELALRIR